MIKINRFVYSFQSALVVSLCVHMLFLLIGWRNTFGDSFIKDRGDEGYISISLLAPEVSQSERPGLLKQDLSNELTGEMDMYAASSHREQGGGDRANPYLALLREKIIRAKRYPLRAQLLNIRGRTKIAFLIRADGEVENIRVIDGSGHAVLDKESCRAIKRAGPFPPIPTEMPYAHLEVALTLQYEL